MLMARQTLDDTSYRMAPRVGVATAPAVDVRGLSKRYGALSAVDDVSFSIRPGAFVTLLGPSGSGKTTILRMIAGFVTPSSGEIFISGKPASSMAPYRRSIGVVFQTLALFPHMTVAANVAYPLRCRRFDPRLIPDLVEQYLDLVRLKGLGKRRVGELSGGQRQRVAIARALVYRPDLLLLDEPLAALDTKLRLEIQDELRRIQSELGVTTLNVTHDQREALVMSDEIIVMDGGRVQQAAAPRTIYERPANRFVASFIGTNNILAGHSIGLPGGAMPGDGEPGTATAPRGDQIDFALRAERIRIGLCREQLGKVECCLPGVVATVGYEGDRALFEVDLVEVELGDQAATRLKVSAPATLDMPVQGQGVFVGWCAGDLTPLGALA